MDRTDMSQTIHVVCPHCNTTNRVPADRLDAGDTGGKCGKCGQPLFAAHPVELTEANFEQQVGKSDLPVIVDFWAPWCGPCRSMAPHFERAAGELEPRARLAKLNTEESQQIAARFGIRSIPTLIAFRNGREVARQSGAMDSGALVRWAQNHIQPLQR